MSMKTLYKTDPAANETGVWVSYPANSDGSVPRFRLARMNAAANKKYGKELERATKPFRREIELETLDDATSDKLMLEVFADTVLLEWEHFQPEDDGNDLAYSRENVIAILSDPEWAELYEDLRERARKAALFRLAQQEREAKN